MAKGRMILEKILGSPDFQALNLVGRHLFENMILLSDHEGMVRRDLDWLRRRIFPGLRISRTVMEQQLDICRTRLMLRFAERDGVSYYQLTNFKLYQGSKALRREGKVREEKERDDAPSPCVCLTDEQSRIRKRLVDDLGMNPEKAAQAVVEHKHDDATVDSWMGILASHGGKLARWGAMRYSLPEQMKETGIDFESGNARARRIVEELDDA